jgi:hypothetical protein
MLGEELAMAAHLGATRLQLEELFRKTVSRREVWRIHSLLSPEYRSPVGQRHQIGGRPRSARHMRRLSRPARRWLSQMLIDYLTVQGEQIGGVVCSRPAALVAAWRIFDSYLATVDDPRVRAEFSGLEFDVLVFASFLIHERRLVIQHCSHCASAEVVIDLKYQMCAGCNRRTVTEQGDLHACFTDASRF